MVSTGSTTATTGSTTATTGSTTAFEYAPAPESRAVVDLRSSYGLFINGEFVDGQALAFEGAWVRYDGEGRPPVTDGPFAETKDLIAGWMIIDVDGWDRAVELAGELSAAPGAGGRPIHEWLELRPFLGAAPTTTE